MATRRIARSAISGRFISAAEARWCPSVSVFETVDVPTTRVRRARRSCVTGPVTEENQNRRHR